MPSAFACPDQTCQAPAQIIGRWTLDSTDGPVEHVKTSCMAGHVFIPGAESLAAIRASAVLCPGLTLLSPPLLRAAGGPPAISSPARAFCI